MLDLARWLWSVRGVGTFKLGLNLREFRMARLLPPPTDPRVNICLLCVTCLLRLAPDHINRSEPMSEQAIRI